MIKLLGACFHNNVGDCLTTWYQRGLLELLTHKDAIRISYGVFTNGNLSELQYDTSALVIGCGGQFGAWHNSPLFCLDNENLYSQIHIPIIIWASGFNIYYKCARQIKDLDVAFYTRTKHLFEHSKLIGLRTIGDTEIAKMFSANNPYFSPDPIIFIGSDTKSTRKKIGIVIDTYCNISFPNIIKDLIDYFSGYDIVPICHEEHDIKLWNKADIFSMKQYQDLEFVISGKFHSGLFATAYGKPFFTLEDNLKQTFYREMIYPDDENIYITPNNRETLFDKLSYFISNIDYYKQQTISKRFWMLEYHQQFCNLLSENI